MINQVGGLSAFRNNSNGGRTGTGGTIVTNDTTKGYRQLTGSLITIVDNNVAGTYSAHDVKIQMQRTDSTTTNGANGLAFKFYVPITAAADDAFGGAINLSVTSRVDIVYPSTTYLTNSWGDVETLIGP
jgi:hypothetical protein